MAENASIIVVNFNSGDRLTRCIEALIRTAPAAEIIVIDNGSSDGSADLPDDLARAVTIRRNRQNTGYAAALNLGAAIARHDLLIFSNMDVIVERDWLAPLSSVLHDRADAGAVNPLIVLLDGAEVNAAGQNIHLTGLGFNRGLNDPIAKYGQEPFEVSGIQGAFFAMRRDVYEKIGGFDASGFLYHEDVNLSWLLRLAGYRLYCAPRAHVRHDYFLSMDAGKFHLLERNRVAMLLAYMKPATRLLLLPFLVLTESMAWVYAAVRRHGFLRAKWQSYRWVLQHRKVIRERRAVAGKVRTIGDLALMRRLHWSYDWKQFLTLAGERGAGRRFAGRRPV